MASLGIFIKNLHLQRFITQTVLYLELKFGVNSQMGNPGATRRKKAQPPPLEPVLSALDGARRFVGGLVTAQLSPHRPESCRDGSPGLSDGSGATAWPSLGSSRDSGTHFALKQLPRDQPPQGLWGLVEGGQYKKSDLGPGPSCCPTVWGKVLGLLNASSSRCVIVTMRLREINPAKQLWKVLDRWESLLCPPPQDTH